MNPVDLGGQGGNAGASTSTADVGQQGGAPTPQCEHPPAETLDAIFCSFCGAYKPTRESPLKYFGGNSGSASLWSGQAGHAAGAADTSKQPTNQATITIEGKPVVVTTEGLDKLASTMAQGAAAAGCRGVIVALSIEKGGHSYYQVRAMGPCLEIEGLAGHVPEVLAALWPKHGLPAPGGACSACGGTGSMLGNTCMRCMGTKREP